MQCQGPKNVEIPCMYISCEIYSSSFIYWTLSDRVFNFRLFVRMSCEIWLCDRSIKCGMGSTNFEFMKLRFNVKFHNVDSSKSNQNVLEFHNLRNETHPYPEISAWRSFAMPNEFMWRFYVYEIHLCWLSCISFPHLKRVTLRKFNPYGTALFVGDIMRNFGVHMEFRQQGVQWLADNTITTRIWKKQTRAIFDMEMLCELKSIQQI